MIEIWKQVPTYKGEYSISSLGIIKRDSRPGKIMREKIMKPRINKEGYAQITLSKKGIAKTYLLHRLVCHAFKGKCPALKEVNHKDGNKLNNCLSNLEYKTRKKNIIHSFRLGLSKPIRGSRNISSKLNENDVLEIRKKYSEGNIFLKDLAKQYGVSQSLTAQIVRKEKWTHI